MHPSNRDTPSAKQFCPCEKRCPLVTESTTYIHGTCCQIFLSFLESPCDVLSLSRKCPSRAGPLNRFCDTPIYRGTQFYEIWHIYFVIYWHVKTLVLTSLSLRSQWARLQQKLPRPESTKATKTTSKLTKPMKKGKKRYGMKCWGSVWPGTDKEKCPTQLFVHFLQVLSNHVSYWHNLFSSTLWL